MKLHDRVEVIWEDAISGGDADWVDPSKYRYVPHIQKSIGYFLMRTDLVLVVYQTWDEKQGMAGDVLRIPAGMVRKVTHLK